MPTLRQAVKRLRDRWMLPKGGAVSLKDLGQRFQPVRRGSMRSLLQKMNMLADEARPIGGGTHPYYRRAMPKPQDSNNFRSDAFHIDLSKAHLPPYPEVNASGPLSDRLAQAVAGFDARAASAIRASANPAFIFSEQARCRTILGDFNGEHQANIHNAILEKKVYPDPFPAPTIHILRASALAMMAYQDFFPNDPARLSGPIFAVSPESLRVAPGREGEPLGEYLRDLVNSAIFAASPGWCGSFGPGVDGLFDIIATHPKGDYDMTEMHLLQIVYRYYDELSHDARELLINALLAAGRIHRPNRNDRFTSGDLPDDWSSAGFVKFITTKIRIAETENHILTISTARYLTNQLLYQREPRPEYDNRRNGGDGIPTCTELMLYLLRSILRDDFSEYNAKPYQTQTRSALLNLCSYAYDHEVRLAARMVLDYISAQVAVSSNDLRRMVPFRRINENENVTRFEDLTMNVGLLEWFLGADRAAEVFAIQAGNTRAYETTNDEHVPPEAPRGVRPVPWMIASGGGDATMEALSDYRLPPSIHDLFVNDLHRRFFQRLHRFVRTDEVEGTSAIGDERGWGGRNADNMEIYAGSPSYLITAGGSPATYAIDPGPAATIAPGDQARQLGVAMPTSFMPTGLSAGPGTQNRARDLIQFSHFSDAIKGVDNYGVAPDFACGYKVHLPDWCLQALFTPSHHLKFEFVDKGGTVGRPGFFLALFRDGDFTVMEAFDTWLHPGVTIEQFVKRVLEKNNHLAFSGLQNNVEAVYETHNGNRVNFVIWHDIPISLPDARNGAKITKVEYGGGDPMDSEGDAGNATDQFLRGTVMNSREEAVVEITNHFFPDVTNRFLGTKITLDMNDGWHPVRRSETGEVEEAGSNHEVWVNFGWTGPSEGDFFRPFNSIAAAVAAVADGGVIKIMPGWTTERPSIRNNKRIRLVAPIGNVTFGVR